MVSSHQFQLNNCTTEQAEIPQEICTAGCNSQCDLLRLLDPSVGYLRDIFVYEPTDIFLCTHDKYSVCNTQLRYKPSAV